MVHRLIWAAVVEAVGATQDPLLLTKYINIYIGFAMLYQLCIP